MWHYRKRRVRDLLAELKTWCLRLAERLWRIALPLLDWPPVLAALIALAFIVYGAHYVNGKLNVTAWLRSEPSTWFEEHYARLDVTSARHVTGQKRNLIFVSLESIESGFSDTVVFGEDLLPELTALGREGISFDGWQSVSGTGFTIGGLCAELLGVPLTGPGFVTTRETGWSTLFSTLDGSPSVIDLLRADGYATAFFTGGPASFTHKAEFFARHGAQRENIYTRERYIADGFPLDDSTKGTGWGFRDAFVWDRVRDWLSGRAPDSGPFCLVMETVDTHKPVGFYESRFHKFGDHRDAVRAASGMVGEFLAWARKQPWYERTTVVLVGDHRWQDARDRFATEFTRKLPSRQVYNLILNPARDAAAGKDRGPRRRQWSSMDLAPTILEAMGIEFRSRLVSGRPAARSIGLGVSLFAPEQNLVERYGAPQVNLELSRQSRLYDSLFRR